MWALQAWGELALGLAAPRAAHHSAGNDYGNQTLAWDVVSGIQGSLALSQSPSNDQTLVTAFEGRLLMRHP